MSLLLNRIHELGELVPEPPEPVTQMPWLTALAQHSKFVERFRVRGQTDTGKLREEINALPLAGGGLDSLGNQELRTQIKAETGIRITATDITTIRGSAGLLCKKLAAPQAVSVAS